jgi:hypothetical protein
VNDYLWDSTDSAMGIKQGAYCKHKVPMEDYCTKCG